jgi:hypothetical protein
MEIKNKFNIGDTIFYPGAEQENPKVIQATINTLIIKEDESIVYATDYPTYGIKEEDVFDNKEQAKDKLITMLEQGKEKVNKQYQKLIDETKNKAPRKLIATTKAEKK